jgi:hypothetical protein
MFATRHRSSFLVNKNIAVLLQLLYWSVLAVDKTVAPLPLVHISISRQYAEAMG